MINDSGTPLKTCEDDNIIGIGVLNDWFKKNKADLEIGLVCCYIISSI
jgi:hypothetical protein